MAIVKSTSVTNMFATPAVREPAHRDGGVLRESASNVVIAADESASNDLIAVRVPSNARVSQVLLSYADATTGGAIDVGIWKEVATAPGTFEAVDDDLFASAMVLTDGPLWNKDITNESAEYTAAEQEKMLWEVLGLSADPKIDYFVGSDITTVCDGCSTVGILYKVRYVVGP